MTLLNLPFSEPLRHFTKNKIISLFRNKFVALRLMVLQLPIIQTILFIILNVLYIEVPELYLQSFIYIVPFMVTSILIGVWGLNVAVRMIAPYFPEQNLLVSFFFNYFCFEFNEICFFFLYSRRNTFHSK